MLPAEEEFEFVLARPGLLGDRDGLELELGDGLELARSPSPSVSGAGEAGAELDILKTYRDLLSWASSSVYVFQGRSSVFQVPVLGRREKCRRSTHSWDSASCAVDHSRFSSRISREPARKQGCAPSKTESGGERRHRFDRGVTRTSLYELELSSYFRSGLCKNATLDSIVYGDPGERQQEVCVRARLRSDRDLRVIDPAMSGPMFDFDESTASRELGTARVHDMSDAESFV